MHSRREINRRLETLGDIADIMSAMKGLALMEVRALSDFYASQHSMVAAIETAAADFFSSHPEYHRAVEPGPQLCIVVGAEQGFCGDFNQALLERQRQLAADGQMRWLLVGRRLAGALDRPAEIEQTLPGATVADEVPRVLLRLTAGLNQLLAGPGLGSYGLSALYHCASSGQIRLRRLLPLADLPPAATQNFAAELNLPAADFLQGLLEHYLHAVLNDVLYSSLLAENRQRQVHMDSALQRLDEDRLRLTQARNLRRQEEITEEIEVILLATDLLGNATDDD
jgi:F-type H+-transporting ATPase subunit gamma